MHVEFTLTSQQIPLVQIKHLGYYSCRFIHKYSENMCCSRILDTTVDMEETKDSTLRWHNVRNQYFASTAANLIALAQGLHLGWVSPALPLLASKDTPLISGPLTTEQISWIGSINCIGGLVGSLSFGYFTTLLGSKRVILFLALPTILFWVLIYFSNEFHHILIARFLAGWTGGGVESVVILFISEIANDEIRGRLGSVTGFLRNIGILFGYILGATVDYKYVPCISVIVPIIFFIIFMMVPNTPRFYLHRGKYEEAERSLMFYKGCKGNSRECLIVHKELERLKSITNEQKHHEEFHIAYFFKRSAIKGLAIGIALNVFRALSASYTLYNFAVLTLAKMRISVDPYNASIFLAVALTFGSLTTTYLADILGRKLLNLISLSGSAIGLLSTALYYYLLLTGYDLTAYEWMPIFSLSLVIFISSAGIVQLSLICSVEYLPANVRTYGVAIVSCSLCIANFVCAKMFPILMEQMDLHGCLMVYGIGCIFGFLFVLICCKETSIQSLDDIGVKERRRLQCESGEKLDGI